MAPPVFKTCSRGSPAVCDVMLLAKSRCFRESRLRWMMLSKLGVGTRRQSPTIITRPSHGRVDEAAMILMMFESMTFRSHASSLCVRGRPGAAPSASTRLR